MARGCFLFQKLVLYYFFFVDKGVLGLPSINTKEPMILASCFKYDKVYVANMNSLTFTAVPYPNYGKGSRAVLWNPVDEKIYFSTRDRGGSLSDINKMDIDGSNFETILSDYGGVIESMVFDEVTRKIYFYDFISSVHIKMDMDGSNMQLLNVTREPASRDQLNIIPGSRIFVSGYEAGQEIVTFDGEGTVCRNETYTYAASETLVGIDSTDVDLKAEKLYWFEVHRTPGEGYLGYLGHYLLRRDLDDFADGSSIEIVYNSSSWVYRSTTLQLYEEYAYFAHGNFQAPDSSGLARIHIDNHTGDPEVIPIIGDASGCSDLHIYDPRESPFFSNPDLPFKSAEPVYQNDTDVEVKIDEDWYGGFIAHMVLPIDKKITNTIRSWTIKISFPRQVFSLKLQGCEAEIEDRELQTYGRRKGTSYTLRSGPNYEAPQPGEKQRIKVLGKTWRKVRGFKEGKVSATFSANYEPTLDLCSASSPTN